MGDETEAEATEPAARKVAIEVGGLSITIESTSDGLDVVARTALGLFGKVEPLAKRNIVGFVDANNSQTEIRPQPDLTWNGSLWSDGE